MKHTVTVYMHFPYIPQCSNGRQCAISTRTQRQARNSYTFVLPSRSLALLCSSHHQLTLYGTAHGRDRVGHGSQHKREADTRGALQRHLPCCPPGCRSALGDWLMAHCRREHHGYDTELGVS